METERSHRPQRERRGSRRSSQPQQPPATIAVDGTPGAGMPDPDTKAAIARSKSRYKGARPKPPRSISTPSVPAIAPIELSPDHLEDKGRTRPNTTFDGFHDTASATDDEDEPLITLIRDRNGGVQPPAGQVRSPEAPKEPRSTYHTAEPRNGSLEKPRHGVTKAKSRVGDMRHHGNQQQSRAHGHGLRHARADPGDDERKHSIPGQEQRRTALPARPVMVAKKSFTQRIAGFVNPPQSAAEAKAQLKQMISSPIAIEDHNPPPAAQFDAPKSAVNAGDRTVRVKYREFQVPVRIVPSTTPANVIRSVSEKVATPINPDSSVMLESFKQLGLERPLRRYEHIRDVLNSWDNDSQNTLIVESSTTGDKEDDLDMKNVPRNQPNDSSFYLYHSQRPGRWDKRQLILRSDGQMMIAKSSGAETRNICHLSDFDIYIPTPRQMAKTIRPPKRICFAVKSQQKSNMFMSTMNYVHFFSSNDKKMAKALYTAVQEWRSWYLVNVMGKGVEQPSQPTGGPKQATARTNMGQKSNDLKQRTYLIHGAQPPQPAPPKPSFEASKVPFIQHAQASIPLASQTTRVTLEDHFKKQIPHVAPQHSSAGSPVGDPFSNGGLLSQPYTERQKAQQDREVRLAVVPVHQAASSSLPAKSLSNDLKRSSSQLKKPKPLIDLTPHYQEPPQHSRKGRGVTPGQIPARGL
ncbi:MAG: hypothetical protein LQ338_002477, partial [Usnochroma carphineum]